MITTIKKRFIFCLFPCVLSFWFCFASCAHPAASPPPRTHARVDPSRLGAGAFVHVAGLAGVVFVCARLVFVLFGLPPPPASRPAVRKKSSQQNTVRKPQPTKCRFFMFFIIFPIFFFSCSILCFFWYLLGFLFCFFRVCQIYIRFCVFLLSF